MLFTRREFLLLGLRRRRGLGYAAGASSFVVCSAPPELAKYLYLYASQLRVPFAKEKPR